MATIRNGYVPASALVEVQSGVLLETATAAAYLRAKRENPRIRIAMPAGGYRNHFVQGDMKRRPHLYGLNQASSVGLAAPGYSSHGTGTRVDIVGDNAWFLRNAARFGFTREFGAADPNHYEFLSPTWANASSAGGGVTPIDPTPEPEVHYYEENDMRIIWLCNESSDEIPVPNKPGKKFSRVWGGIRTIGGVPFSNGWDSATGQRLTVSEHKKLRDLNTLWAKDARNKSGAPLLLENFIHPNELEQILVARGLA